MELRLLRAALFVDRGGLALAVVAVAIGASVASALLHVSGDISRRLAHELRALGPNVLVLPARCISDEEGKAILKTFLDTPFEGGRHERRVEKIEVEPETK